MTTRRLTCPICKGEKAPREKNEFFPFCSNRCRLVDLGNWLDEGYRVPVTETERSGGGSENEG